MEEHDAVPAEVAVVQLLTCSQALQELAGGSDTA